MRDGPLAEEQSEREMGCGLLKSTVKDSFTFYIVQKLF
jgi:hypothetical protein